MPPDRLFGRLEKELRKCESILSPEEYYKFYRNHATVKILGENWLVYDFKSIQKSRPT